MEVLAEESHFKASTLKKVGTKWGKEIVEGNQFITKYLSIA